MIADCQARHSACAATRNLYGAHTHTHARTDTHTHTRAHTSTRTHTHVLPLSSDGLRRRRGIHGPRSAPSTHSTEQVPGLLPTRCGWRPGAEFCSACCMPIACCASCFAPCGMRCHPSCCITGRVDAAWMSRADPSGGTMCGNNASLTPRYDGLIVQVRPFAAFVRVFVCLRACLFVPTFGGLFVSLVLVRGFA